MAKPKILYKCHIIIKAGKSTHTVSQPALYLTIYSDLPLQGPSCSCKTGIRLMKISNSVHICMNND